MSALVCGIPDSYALEFNYDHTGPVIRQDDDPTAGVTGDDLLIHAQDVGGAGGPTGGGLVLRSGGDTGTATNPSSGDVELYCGAIGGAGVRGSGYVGRDVTNANANWANPLYLAASNDVRIEVAGTWRLNATAGAVRLNVPDFYFLSTAASPAIYQEADGTAAVVGDDLLIHAQDVSGAGGPTGGGLVLRSGGDTGAATNPSSGDVEMYCGAVGGAGGRGLVYVGRDAAATAANRAGQVIVDAASSIWNEIGGAYKLNIWSAYAELFVPVLAFQLAVVAPEIRQNTDNTAAVVGEDLIVHAQDVGDPAGAATGGNLGLRGGLDDSATGNTEGNVWFHAAAANYQGMELGIFVGDCGAAPGGNPANGGFLYSNAGAGTWRGSGGTVTAFGPADQHCEKCGYDFWTNHYENADWGAYLKQCGMCGEIYKKGPQSVLAKLTSKQKRLMVRHKAGERS